MTWTRPIAIPLVIATATVVLLALGAVATHAERSHPEESLSDGTTTAILVLLAAGLGTWTAGWYYLVRTRGRSCGALLLCVGPVAYLGVLGTPSIGSGPLFTTGLVVAGLAGPLAGAAALAHVAPRWARAAWAAVAVAVSASLAPVLVLDPRSAGCFACPPNRLDLHPSSTAHTVLERGGLVVTAVVCAVLAGSALLQWWRSHPVSRTFTAAVAWPGAVAALVGTVVAVRGLVDPVLDSSARALWLVQTTALLGLSIGVAWRIALAWRLRDRVAALVLETLPDAGALRRTLASEVGDPGLEIVFRHREDGVDADGRPARPPTDRQTVLPVARGGVPFAEVRHDVALDAVPERFGGAVRASGLALEHAAARARNRAGLLDLESSRARLVAAGDAERRRLERNLHDGAQQRLIATTIALQTALDHTTERRAAEALRGARSEIRLALEELREIAGGIYPVALSDAGLGAALRELAESAGVPLLLQEVPQERGDGGAEALAYRAVADTVAWAERGGDGGAVEVKVRRHHDHLRAEITTPGRALDYEVPLQHAADRARTLGGDVQLHDEADAVRIEVVVPCAW